MVEAVATTKKRIDSEPMERERVDCQIGRSFTEVYCLEGATSSPPDAAVRPERVSKTFYM